MLSHFCVKREPHLCLPVARVNPRKESICLVLRPCQYPHYRSAALPIPSVCPPARLMAHPNSVSSSAAIPTLGDKRWVPAKQRFCGVDTDERQTGMISFLGFVFATDKHGCGSRIPRKCAKIFVQHLIASAFIILLTFFLHSTLLSSQIH